MKHQMGDIVDTETVFETQWFKVEAKAVLGERSPYFSLTLPDYVAVLAITKKNKVLLVRQFRPVIERETLELPSGHVEEGQTPEEAAYLELLEETGYEAKNLELMGVLAPDLGRLSNKLWCFFAAHVSKRENVDTDAGIHLVQCNMLQLRDYLRKGELNHAQNLAALFLAQQAGKISVMIGNKTQSSAN